MSELEPVHPSPPAFRLPGGRTVDNVAGRATAGESFSEADYDLMRRGVAPKTAKTLREAWKRVLAFTGGYGYLEVPMPVATCVKMFDWAWQQKGWRGQPYAPATLNGMLWAITKAHKVARRPDGERGYKSPVDSEEVRRAMRGYRKKYRGGRYRSRKATPISPEEQIAMVKAMDPRSVMGLQGALALSWLYDGGFRAGELVVPKELSEEMHRYGVEFEHVELNVRTEVDWDAVDWRRPWDIDLFTEDGDQVLRTDHLVIHVPESKTDQEGDGDEVMLPAHPPQYAFNCPVRLFIAWTKLLMECGHERRGTVLRVIRYGGPGPKDGRPRSGKVTEEPLGYDGLAVLFRRWVAQAGLDAPGSVVRNFLLHGMRAGSAEAAADGGADTPELNRHFRWSQFGTTAQRYAARALKRRKNPARRIWAVA